MKNVENIINCSLADSVFNSTMNSISNSVVIHVIHVHIWFLIEYRICEVSYSIRDLVLFSLQED